MVKSKPSCPPGGNESKIPVNKNKGQPFKPNKYRGKKYENKPSLDPKAKPDFQGRCTDLVGYIFDLGPRESDKSA